MVRWRSYLRNWEYTVSLFVVGYFVLINFVLEFKGDEGIPNLRSIPNEVIEYFDRSNTLDFTRKLAYAQYATEYEYFNLAIINFITIRESKSKIDNLVILYDKTLEKRDSSKFEKLRVLASPYDISLTPVESISVKNSGSSDWASSFTKFHVFDLTQFERVVYFDSDNMFINPQIDNKNFAESNNQPSNFDELFKLPREIDMALPDAYWLSKPIKRLSQRIDVPSQRQYERKIGKLLNDLTASDGEQTWDLLPTLLSKKQKFKRRDDYFASHVILLKPSKEIFKTLKKMVHNPTHWKITGHKNARGNSDYDMEILNRLIDDKLKSDSRFNVGILPHRVYGVLTGEFRELWHSKFMGEPQYLPFIERNSNENWRPLDYFKKIKSVHFSDAPIPKPWEHYDEYEHYNSYRIYCNENFNYDDYIRTFPGEWKARRTDDCDSVRIWDWIMFDFHKEYLSAYWVIQEQ